MSNSYDIKFQRTVTRPEWLRFCENNGLAFCENISGFSTFAGFKIEVVLNAEGTSTPPSPPERFTGVRVTALTDDPAKTVSLAKKIAARFDGTITAQEAEQGEATWGDSVVSIEPRVEYMDAKRAVLFAKRSLAQALSSNIGDSADIDTVREAAQPHLDFLVDRGVISKGSVTSARRVKVDWPQLYEGRWSRMKAKLAHKVLGLSAERAGTPNLLERWLGYRHEHRVSVDNPDGPVTGEFADYAELAVYVKNMIDAEKIRITDVSMLLVPYEKLETDVSIVPSRSANHITMSVVIGK